MSKSKKYKVKGFSYHIEKDIDVIEYIKKQPNEANYIIGLIRSDMNKTDNDIEALVKKYVEELLRDKSIQFEDKKEGNISKDNIADLLNIGR